MLSHIPQMRLLIYLLIVASLPTLFVVFRLWQDKGHLDSLEGRVEIVREKALMRNTKQATNVAIMNHYRGADNFYIDKQLEKLQFLSPEVEGLQHILLNKSFADDEEARKRLEFLTGPNNTLKFNEGAVVRYPLFREIVETQIHPVEVDTGDVQKILTLVEGQAFDNIAPPTNRPQLIILDFRMDKKKVGDDNEVFVLNLRLLKREYI